jgi:hypothetical protein
MHAKKLMYSMHPKILNPRHMLLHSIHPLFCKGINHEVCFSKSMTEGNITKNRRKPRKFNEKIMDFSRSRTRFIIQFTTKAKADSTKKLCPIKSSI